jgi:hypothetical protein
MSEAMTEQQRDAWWAITAYHEAGHVIAALVCGFPFEYVTIAPYEDAITSGLPDILEMELGHLKLTDEPLTSKGIDVNDRRVLSQAEVGIVHRVMVQSLAGYYEAKLIIEKGPDKELYGALDDMHVVRMLATSLAAQPSAQPDRYYLGQAATCAQEVIADAEEMVHTLACALLRAGRLTYAESIAALPGPSLTEARMSFLMGQPDTYLSKEDRASLATWLAEEPETTAVNPFD